MEYRRIFPPPFLFQSATVLRAIESQSEIEQNSLGCFLIRKKVSSLLASPLALAASQQKQDALKRNCRITYILHLAMVRAAAAYIFVILLVGAAASEAPDDDPDGDDVDRDYYYEDNYYNEANFR